MKGKDNMLVIGGGIAGIQASLDLADRGFSVYLVEKAPSIGGRMAQLDKTFPTMDCSICILAPKMVEALRHPNINLMTYSEVQDVTNIDGGFHVKVVKKPRFIDEERCVGCGICASKCPIEQPNEFNMGLDMRKAIYVPFPQSVPLIYCIDKEHCLYFTKRVCRICEKFCESKAINFEQKEEIIKIDVAAIIIATGLTPFDPSEIKEYGYRRYKNVTTALELERMVSATGPTSGKLVKPSDGTTPHRIAFFQCVGSRSERKGYPYCSSVCCMHATKEAILVKEHEPESEVYIFYIDLRAFGKGFREFINRAKEVWGIKYVNGKPGEIREDPETKDLMFRYEDILSGDLQELRVDLVVLCTALVPRPENRKLAKVLGIEIDEHGFFKAQHPLLAAMDTIIPRIFVCGYCQGPKDVSESITQASAAAARAAETTGLISYGMFSK